MRTQVAIIGAGPAGLMLSHLLHQHGIESVILERHDRAYIERRLRAGVLEQGTVDLLRASGLGERMDREGLTHHGIYLQFAGERHRIAMTELTERSITVYGQHEVVKDLIAARLAVGGVIRFETSDVSLHDIATEHPSVQFSQGGERHQLECDIIAGCDGFHGVSRPSIPEGALAVYQKTYPFAWLGILARTPPAVDELIYAYHERGFALQSMRSPELSRLYVQCSPEDSLDQWPDERIWVELQARLALSGGETVNHGPILDRGITTMRSFVVEPMRFGRLFLAGDAAHVVPPTGAKGMNLAIADVKVLAPALATWFAHGSADLLESYSETCLRRVWRAEHFSWWMTSMLHRFDHEDAFQYQLQLSQLRYTVSSRAAATSLAENYVGLEQI
jgi:p-hydroxybenzoate 3-monooxygenase